MMKNGSLRINSLKKIMNEKSNNVQNVFKVEENIDKDIAVIGMGCQFADANGLDEYWSLLCNDKECTRELPQDRKRDADKYYNFIKGNEKDKKYHKFSYMNEIDKFDYGFFDILPKEAEFMSPNQRLFLENAWNAMEDAGYTRDMVSGSNTGIFVGVTGESSNEYMKLVNNADPEYMGSVLIGNLNSIMAARLAYILNLKGPALVIDTACSSSLVAIHLACKSLLNKECDLAIAGGVNLTIIPDLEKENEVKLGIESSDNRTRTFDDNSDGTNGGEGCASIILKTLDKAIRDKDNIYAVIKGSAVNQDGSSVGITAPNLKSQQEVILKAWKDADINPSKLSYIEAHGTGTELGDPIEIQALHNAFAKYTSKKQFCGIGSVKTNIGHTSSLSGIAGLIKVILSMKNGKIPSSLNFKIPNRKINFIESPLYVNDRLREIRKGKDNLLCGISSFGISGTNCHMVVESRNNENEDKERNESNESNESNANIIAVSAKSIESLKGLLDKYVNFIKKKNYEELNDICYTSNVFRDHYKYRVAFIVKDKEDLIMKMNYVQTLELDEDYFNKHINNYTDSEKERLMNKVKEVIENNNIDISSLELIKEAYESGIDINWNLLYKNTKARKIHIPTYCYKKSRCWFELPIETNVYYKLINNYKLLDKEILPEELKSELNSVMIKYEECVKSKIKVKNDDNNIILQGREIGDYNPKETLIAKLWGELTNYDKVNIFDDFFDMGMDSVQASIFVGKLRRYFNVNLTDVFNHSTIIDLAKNIELSENDLKNKITAIKNSILSNDNSKIYENKNLEKEISIYEEKNKKYNDIGESKKYENILLTGATGYLGIYMFRDLLNTTNSNIYLIIRSNENKTSIDRLKEKIDYYFNENIMEKFKNRIFVIDGDLTKTCFGLTEDTYNNLALKIDCIIHSAANTKHFGKYSSFEKVNVKGTELVVEFASVGKMKDLNFISTMAVMQGKLNDLNSRIFTEYDMFLNSDVSSYYIRSKIEAESIVIKAREKGLKTNIFRVGNIVFDSVSGSFQENIEDNAFYLIIKSFIKLGIVPNMPIVLDCSCVNYVSKAIITLFNKNKLNNEVFHINNPIGLNISEIISDERMNLNVKKVSINYFFDYIYKNYDNKELSTHIQNLILHLFGDFQEKDNQNGVVLPKSNKTVQVLKNAHFKWNEVNREEIKNMLKYCKKINFI